MRAIFIFSFMVLLLQPPMDSYAKDKNHPVIDERGAVLCIWSVYVLLKSMGSYCYPDRDRAFLDAADSAILRMDRFIKRNSKATDKDIIARKAKLKIQALEMIAKDNAGQCDPKSGSLDFYEQFRNSVSPAILQKQMDELLSVDRPPVMNPCF